MKVLYKELLGFLSDIAKDDQKKMKVGTTTVIMASSSVDVDLLIFFVHVLHTDRRKY